MTDPPHRCDDSCVCPIHGTPLYYWPAGDDHACQDPQCQHAHGVKDPVPLPDVEVEIVADASHFTDAVQRAQASVMFGFHPDLREPGERRGPRSET
jgi:hypothetical protein